MQNSILFFISTFLLGSVVGKYLLNQGFPLMYATIICLTLGLCLGFTADYFLPRKEDEDDKGK